MGEEGSSGLPKHQQAVGQHQGIDKGGRAPKVVEKMNVR
jgi:hypothetical protein